MPSTNNKIKLKNELRHGRDNVIKLARLFTHLHKITNRACHLPMQESKCLAACTKCTLMKLWKHISKTEMQACKKRILNTLLETATLFGFSLTEAIVKKMHVNEEKCPVHLVQVSVLHFEQQKNESHSCHSMFSFEQTFRAMCM